MANLTEYGGADGYANHLRTARLADAAGHPVSLVSVEHEDTDPQAWVRYGDGPQVMVPVSLLVQEADGAYRLPFSFNASSAGEDEAFTVPVIQEGVEVGKRVVDTGKGIRLRKTVTQREQVVDQPLLRDELAIEHIAINRVIAQEDMPQPRYDGETLVVPVFEEVLVVQKQLLFKEEVRITRNRLQVHEAQTVHLRSEQVDVERFDEGKH